MLQRHLGRSGLQVSRLALGTMTWGTQVDTYDAGEMLGAFLDAGGTTIDTAPFYGEGRTEALLGEVLAASGARDRVVLAGTCGLAHRDGRVVHDTARGAMLDQLDRSLQDLRTDHLDLWQVHRWDPTVQIEETLAALEHAVDSGKARYVGVSAFEPWQTALAHTWLAGRPTGHRLVADQTEYSLLHRRPEQGLVEAVGHLGMGLLACSPLGRGVLTGKYRSGVPADSRGADPAWGQWLAEYLGPEQHGVVEALAKAAEGLGVTCAQAALAWVRDRPAVGAAIVGARTAEQLAELLASESVDLPAEIVLALDDVSEGVRT